MTGAVAVETCERAAVFVAARTAADSETGVRAAREALDAPDPRVERGRAAVEHLTRLACGLESPILGEDHVLGQLRRAFETARGGDDETIAAAGRLFDLDEVNGRGR